jgi:uncharacterized membrane protein YdfJ with MMPL/SSD domain
MTARGTSVIIVIISVATAIAAAVTLLPFLLGCAGGVGHFDIQFAKA